MRARAVALCASNPLSTQDDAAGVARGERGISVFARKGEDRDTYFQHINAGARDEAADHDGRRRRRRDAACTPTARSCSRAVKGGTEETTTGVIRLRAMAGRRACSHIRSSR
jgi:adenosylhomocysteinase